MFCVGTIFSETGPHYSGSCAVQRSRSSLRQSGNQGIGYLMPLFGREIEHATIAGRRDAPPKALRAQRRGAISRIRATISSINPGTSNKIPANMTWPPRLSACNAVRLPWSKTTRMRVIMSTAEVAPDKQTGDEGQCPAKANYRSHRDEHGKFQNWQSQYRQ